MVGGELVPSFFTDADHGWLAALLDEYAQSLGLRRVAALGRLGRPVSVRAPSGKVRLAAHVLGRASRQRVASPVPPRALRTFAFEAAARGAERAAVVEAAAREFGIDPSDVPRFLFADLGGERVLSAPDSPFGVAELAQAANATLVAGLLGRAARISIAARGGIADLVRATRRAGLVCVLRPGTTDDSVLLEASGPYALFRHTALYRRAIVSLVPWAARCAKFALRAECVIENGGVVGTLHLRSGDPIAWSEPRPAPASRMARRLARDFSGATADWQLIAERGPVRAERGWWWPDFEIRHRNDSDRRWLLEIATFWTRRALEERLAFAREERLGLVVCVDVARNCGRRGLPEDARLVPFTGRIEPGALVTALEAARAHP
jgi:uncharacterized protein